ncbi:MAG: GTPase HflX [Burkholderiales bacterium]
MYENEEKPKRAIVAAVQLPHVGDRELDASLTELRQLAKTLGYEVVGSFTQKRARFDSAAYFGVGKRDEIKRWVRGETAFDSISAIGLPSNGTPDKDPEKYLIKNSQETENSETNPGARRADLLLVDHEISPMQARNLEKETGCDVMDRTMVILEIFHRHARSKAAIAQVEIVRLGYMAPRLREAAKEAGPQGRQRSGVGGRGAGESLGEADRRKIRDRIAELQKELDAMDAERKTQRARRQERQGLARVALVGYTNAGKSTLMRALTGSEVLVANKLFATLDTTVRALHPESVPRVLVSDTVGFIENLPHGLVASFKSTLEEALEASLLLHVIDASDPGFERQLAVTEKVLDEIGAKGVPRLLIFNKIDQAGDAQAQADHQAALRLRYPDCVVMSARRAGDIDKLRSTIIAFFQGNLIETELFLPWSSQKMRGEIFDSCVVLEERADNDGAFLRVRGEAETVKRLSDLCAPRP